MIKNRYIVGSLAFLLVLLILILSVLPKLEQKSDQLDSSSVERVFDQTKVKNVDITVNESDWQSLLDNPLAEKYVEATIEIDGTTLENVGLRTKGNSSLTSVAGMEDSDRYSFKLDFDYYNSNQSLFGLKKLNLNNNFSDATQMKEYLSYQLMDKMGLPTPANSYMYVTINGQEWGLYLGVEQVDEVFIARNFEDKTGDLYKPEGTGSDLKWISDQIKDYSGLDLKTNLNSSDQSAMIEMLAAINNGEDIEEHLDIDEMLRYFAANTALVNLDSYQGQMKHNYYLYEQNGKFSIIPWDYNMAFGGFGVGRGGGFQPGGNDQEGMEMNRGNRNFMGGFPTGDLMNEENINFSITTPVSGTTLQERPLLNSLLSVDQYREKYEQYLAEIANTFLTKESIESITTEISNLILPYVEKDPTKFYTTEEFLAGVSGNSSLPEFARLRAESIKKQLAGELVVEADTDSGMMMPQDMGEWQGQLGEEPPNFPNGNMEPPNRGEEEQGRVPPNFNNGEQPKMEWNNQGDMPFPIGDKQRAGQDSKQSQSNLTVSIILFSLLIGAIIFGFLFKRRW